MINGKKIVVIMPAYNAEKTLEITYNEIYKDFVDKVILVDDNSLDNTKDVSKNLISQLLCIMKTKDTGETKNLAIQQP